MDVLELSKKLISINSITPDSGVALSLIEEVLSSINFTVTRLPFNFYDYDNDYNVDNLYATIGSGEKNLCFAGHVDVVPVGDSELWRFDPFTPTVVNENGKDFLYGRGAVDMKTAIAAFISAVTKYINTCDLTKHTISFLLTGDEECGSINGTQSVLKWLKEKNINIDLCIIGEMTSNKVLGDCGHIGRRGSITMEIIVYGKQGHIAYPERFCNPVTILNNIIWEINNYKFAEEISWFDSVTNCEVININTNNVADNVVPSEGMMRLNIRFTKKYEVNQLMEIINNICMKYTNNYKIMHKVHGLPFVEENQMVSELLKDSVYEVLNIIPKMSTAGGTSDARFINSFCSTIEFGMLEETAHQIDEKVMVEDIYVLEKIYFTMIDKYFKSNL